MAKNDPIIRLIEARDNAEVKKLVQETLAEFGISGAGFAGVDAELDDMHAAYADELSDYYVIELNDAIVGAGGFAPLAGTEPGSVAELRKMYFRSVIRGMGLGQELITLCIKEAMAKGFYEMYLETTEQMKAAQNLYLKNGFNYINTPMGDTGHTGCGVRMLKILRMVK